MPGRACTTAFRIVDKEMLFISPISAFLRMSVSGLQALLPSADSVPEHRAGQSSPILSGMIPAGSWSIDTLPLTAQAIFHGLNCLKHFE